VLDEAHHLEDVAAHHLGTQVSMLGVQRLLGRLERNGRGLLPALAAELSTHDDLLGSASRDLLTRSVLDALVAARRWADELFGRLARRLDTEQAATPVLRLTDSFAADGVWREGLDVALDNLLVASANCATASRRSPTGCRSTIPPRCARDCLASCAASCDALTRLRRDSKPRSSPSATARPPARPSAGWNAAAVARQT